MTDAREPPASALRSHGLRPRKRLGQNFLNDERFLGRIVAAADLQPGEEVLEVGAGTGVLTEALRHRAGRVVAVELDDALYDLLLTRFGGSGNVEVVHDNALSFDACAHFADGYKLVANIPYYITGHLVRHYLESVCRPSLLVLMVQREVAERMAAAPGNLSLLGVSVQVYAEPKIVARVPAGAFFPRPRVDSAIISLRPRASQMDARLRDALFELARAGFGVRRKQLANALSTGLQISRDGAALLLDSAKIDRKRRAETLSLSEWEDLARRWMDEPRWDGS